MLWQAVVCLPLCLTVISPYKDLNTSDTVGVLKGSKLAIAAYTVGSNLTTIRL